ncbi:hypothetical protein PoB_001358600 [Plakobranchus ocellatus]|uniref:Uncharacterized protein n=1 Tax=Plakobranchus ocellatus TaxID=259542 RepID=A0AAV3YIJ0_9GAST|nr:hypothetical protein PoB_001358600 [Plakobranchus ocellatus]
MITPGLRKSSSRAELSREQMENDGVSWRKKCESTEVKRAQSRYGDVPQSYTFMTGRSGLSPLYSGPNRLKLYSNSPAVILGLSACPSADDRTNLSQAERPLYLQRTGA